MRLFFLILIFSFLSNIAIGQSKYLTIEPNHSTIGFEVNIANGATKVTGKFMETDLQLTYVDGDWTKSAINFIIKAESINTGIEDRDKHLRTADFFDIEQFPEITFVSKSIEKTDSTHFVVEGIFTMHGVANSMRIPFEVTYEEGNTIGIHLETVVNRMKHGVGVDFKHSLIENFLSEEVAVKIDFWTKKDKRQDKEK